MSEDQNIKKPQIFYLDEEIKAVKNKGILDYRTKRMPIWCPGCGYFGITTALIETLKELDIKTHELFIVSGIGCAGRLPFFFKAYGVNSLHGRALPVASGAKIARPDLNVISIIGDGDGLGIGAAHFVHTARRNVDMLCILFDNGIYGLTKGQTSPTTPNQQVTNSHPYGSPDSPINPISLALSVGATYVARGYAGRPVDMKELFIEGIKHKGFSLVHILSPCVTFDKVNNTYNRLEQLVMPLPKRHDFSDFKVAMERAIDPEIFLGLFYKAEKPTFEEQLKAYANRGIKKEG
jgi:2-oxoglutarate/2-oxoacid ferredoxin oxidoreductase subunit beta